MAEYFAVVTKEGLNAIAYCVTNPPATVMFEDMAVGDLNDGSFPAFWATGIAYTSGIVIMGSNKSLYTCILNHTSAAANEPGVGGSWATYWVLRTVLVNERYRAAVNSVYVHPDNPNWIVIEGVVPDDQGGWWIREVGLYADPGTGSVLFGVAKFPPSYKPILASGSGKDFYIRIILVISPTSVISLVMDPSVILSTQVYVNNYAYWATEADRIWYNVSFEAPVVTGNAVYYNSVTGKFGQAVADGSIKQRAIGFADKTPNYKNPNGQVIVHGDCVLAFAPALTPGLTYYLSTTIPGAITSTPPNRYTVKMGIARNAGEMFVDVDDILSGYEDIAFTSINPSGDVSLVRDLSVGRNLSIIQDAGIGRDLSVVRDIGVGRDVNVVRDVNIQNVLNVGSDGGFPSFRVNTASDIQVTGGADTVWNLIYGLIGGVNCIQILSSHEVSVFMGGMLRGGSVISTANQIPLGNASGKIDSSWLPSVGGAIVGSFNTVSSFYSFYAGAPSGWMPSGHFIMYIPTPSTLLIDVFELVFTLGGGGPPTSTSFHLKFEVEGVAFSSSADYAGIINGSTISQISLSVGGVPAGFMWVKYWVSWDNIVGGSALDPSEINLSSTGATFRI